MNQLCKKILKDYLSGPETQIGQKLPFISELANQYKVSQPTMGKAISVLQSMGYLKGKRGKGVFITAQPAPDAGKPGQTYTIGFLSCSMQRAIPHRILEGISRATSRLRINLQVGNTNWDAKQERWHYENMHRSGVDGVIVYPVLERNEGVDYLNEFPDFPTVIVDTPLTGVTRPTVVFDNWSAGYETARLLLEGGHRRIVFLQLRTQIPHRSIVDRLAGFRRAMEEAEIPEGEYLVRDYLSINQRAANRAAIKKLLANNPLPTAIIAPNDVYAHELIEFIREHDLSVPGDILITGFDNLQEPEWREAFLTTCPNFERMGERSVEMLLQIIEEEARATPELTLPCPVHFPPTVSTESIARPASYAGAREV